MSEFSAEFDQNDDFRCGYCLQQISDMIDPRVLNCSHVFCVECLEKDFRKVNKLECPFCK